MTEEEIEKQSEEYTRNCCVDMTFDIHNIRKAFQDGAKWGAKHAIEWHEIESHVLPKREISKKYMPKANEKLMLKYHFYNETEIHYSDGYYDKFDFEFHIPNNPTGRIICVIAWCELKDKELEK